jgi:molybdenum cofactor biosynthesis enzyme MoaA
MWFGEKAVVFRETLIKQQLTKGCQLCLSQFAAGNFSGIHTKIFDLDLNVFQEKGVSALKAEDYSRWRTMPEILEFELNNTCNLECVMCHGNHSSLIRKNREGLPPIHSPYDERFIEQLRPFIPNIKLARFLGGEPFLIQIYYPIWELFAELNPQAELHITTNATVLNGKVRSILERVNANLIISTDSMVKETFEKIRINAKHERVLEHIRYFAEYCAQRNKIFSFATCPIRENWREMPELVRFCNEKGINLYFNTVEYPDESSLRTLELHEMDEVLACWQEAQDSAFSDSRNDAYPWDLDLKPLSFFDAGQNQLNFAGIVSQLKQWRDELSLETPTSGFRPLTWTEKMGWYIPGNSGFRELEARMRETTLKWLEILPPEAGSREERVGQLSAYSLFETHKSRLKEETLPALFASYYQYFFPAKEGQTEPLSPKACIAAFFRCVEAFVRHHPEFGETERETVPPKLQWLSQRLLQSPEYIAAFLKIIRSGKGMILELAEPDFGIPQMETSFVVDFEKQLLEPGAPQLEAQWDALLETLSGLPLFRDMPEKKQRLSAGFHLFERNKKYFRKAELFSLFQKYMRFAGRQSAEWVLPDPEQPAEWISLYFDRLVDLYVYSGRAGEKTNESPGGDPEWLKGRVMNSEASEDIFQLFLLPRPVDELFSSLDSEGFRGLDFTLAHAFEMDCMLPGPGSFQARLLAAREELAATAVNPLEDMREIPWELAAVRLFQRHKDYFEREALPGLFSGYLRHAAILGGKVSCPEEDETDEWMRIFLDRMKAYAEFVPDLQFSKGVLAEKLSWLSDYVMESGIAGRVFSAFLASPVKDFLEGVAGHSQTEIQQMLDKGIETL